MKIFKSLQEHISKLELKIFYIYCAAIAAATIIFIGGMIWRFYSKIDDIKRSIETVNEQRDEVQKILEKLSSVTKQRKAVDELLKQNKDFTIGGYFKDLVSELRLEQKKGTEHPIVHHPTPDEKYIEATLSAEFSGIDMKELCDLLEKIEQNELVYTKELSITRSKKTANKIDISLMIATLQPQEAGAQ